jgi:hypothetical protein
MKLRISPQFHKPKKLTYTHIDTLVYCSKRNKHLELMKPKFVAKAIHNQLRVGQQNLMRFWSWGSNNFKSGIDKEDNLGFLLFKVSGYKFKGSVKISLSFNDTYKVEFIDNKKVVNTMEEVYCDELNERIDEFVEKQDNYSF